MSAFIINTIMHYGTSKMYNGFTILALASQKTLSFLINWHSVLCLLGITQHREQKQLFETTHSSV